MVGATVGWYMCLFSYLCACVLGSRIFGCHVYLSHIDTNSIRQNEKMEASQNTIQPPMTQFRSYQINREAETQSI